jgi:EAL domain-containing protein (putative c-di-GMP-specific phosphodiesterase class I)
MVMQDINHSINLITCLKKLGIQISLDDFGTGYSSLSYLHRLPLDTIKIDKSFVGQMDKSLEDSTIVNTILSLGHSLGMSIVAEGVETSTQAQMLRQNDCHYGQGYLFARPLDKNQATMMLQD